MGRSRYKFAQINMPHFMTCTVLHWIPVFTRPETVTILLDTLKHLMNEGLKVYAYVILENHIHLIAQSEQIDRDIARFKSYTAKMLIELLTEKGVKTILDQLVFYKKAHKTERKHQFWQEGVHPEWIQNAEMMREKVEYIHRNPVVRGYVDRPEHWRYSSARNYLGMEGLLEICRLW
jgi:REP element-mobilizing transposase RayT